MRKKCILGLPILISFLIVGCGNKEVVFTSKKLVVTVNKEYQLWDTFNASDISVKYDGKELLKEQYTVSLNDFSTKTTGTTRFTVALSYRPKVKKIIEVEVSKRSALSYLAIGNEYALDLVKYVNQFAGSDENLDFSFSALVKSGASLEDINSSFLASKSDFTLYKYNKESQSWDVTEEQSIKTVLSERNNKFDVISLENNALGAVDASHVALLMPLISSMKSFVSMLGKRTPTIAWHETWAYKDSVAVDNMYYELFNNSQQAMFNAIEENVNYITSADFVIESGKLVQNARASTLETSNDFTRDNIHLDDKGAYLISLNLVSILSGYEPSHFPYRGEVVTEEEKAIVDEIISQTLEEQP